ncbi:MAG: DUF1592 domain-containing protein [Planctomycetota bacterium]
MTKPIKSFLKVVCGDKRRRNSSGWLVPAGMGGALIVCAGVLVLLGSRPDTAGGAPNGEPGVVKVQQLADAAVAPDRDPLAQELESRLRDDVQPLIQKYCFECHGEGNKKAGINFDSPGTIEHVLEMAMDWESAVDVLNDRLMPPEDKPQPTQHEILTIQQWVQDALDYYPPDAEPDPGWYTIHRLNRSEYRNTLRDLLGIDPAEHDLAEDLPPDNTGYGFDNNADVLSMSPLQLEKYLDAAERAIEVAFGPVEIGGDRPVPVRRLERQGRGQALDSGGQYLWTNGRVTGRYNFPRAGRYELHVVAWETRAGDEHAKLRVRVAGRTFGEIDVSARRREPGLYKLEIEVGRAGPQQIQLAFFNDTTQGGDRNVGIENVSVLGPIGGRDQPTQAHREVFFIQPNSDDDGNRLPDARGSRRVTESQAARQIIERFASRAFRRPVRSSELVGLLGLYREARKAGDSHEQALRLALTATLVSPNFLYRAVNNPRSGDPDTVYALDSYELASRLSYFLWSSMPDDRLIELAREGSLTDDATLRAEVRRMITDPKASALVENFAGQWLLLRNLEGKPVDTDRFPEYTPELRSAMGREAELFFQDVLKHDRSVLNFLSSDYTFLNQPLAEHYGIKGVRGDDFKRVPLPAGSPRGGVLTMAATLTVTSHPTRTSPVLRGNYVLDQLLGSAPPPPPPDVPPLEEATESIGAEASLREQLAAHVADPNCAVCHKRLDPIGLAMENFTATGAWRELEGGKPIDATGTLPNGDSFDGPTQLKQVLLKSQDQFVENLSRKMLTYAIGRGIEPFDRPTIKDLTEQVHTNQYRLSALIEAIVLSDSFRKCRGREVHE